MIDKILLIIIIAPIVIGAYYHYKDKKNQERLNKIK
tara:strand:+ start:1078 stop:1185 length:108 start_codon:yes stop_codon:yes gene_type:complete